MTAPSGPLGSRRTTGRYCLPNETPKWLVAMTLSLPIECVSDTAFVTAFCRVLESERPDGHFRDPYARTLAGSRGEQLLYQLPGWEFTVSGCTVRTHILDSCILEVIREDAIDTVVNLGAGLDMRPFRLPLPRSLVWIEVDKPGVLDYKATKLAACRSACALQYAPLNAADAVARRALLSRIADSASRVLVITEGLLVYFTPEDVALLARDLHSWINVRWWLSDLVSPTAFQMMRKLFANTQSASDLRLHFAPEDGPAFFSQHGWETEKCRSCTEEGQRLDRWFFDKSLLNANLAREYVDVLHKLFLVVKLKRTDLAIPSEQSPQYKRLDYEDSEHKSTCPPTHAV